MASAENRVGGTDYRNYRLSQINLLEETMKQLNARTQKWRQMLKTNPQSNLSLFKKRVRKGVPCCIRPIVWPHLINLQKHINTQKHKYKQLIKQDTIYGQQICKDIPRTFQIENPREIHRSLFDVLKAISLCFPELGYCQGMNFLTMRLLEIMDDETVFWIVHYLLSKYQKIYWNYRCPEAMELQNAIISELIKKHLPSVHQQFKKQSITPFLYTPPWLITLFSSPLPSQIFYRFFECFLLQGQKILYRTALTMLKLKQTVIEAGNSVMYLADNSMYEGVDPDDFMKVLFEFKLKRSDISRIQSVFNDLNKESIRSMRDSANQAARKRMKSTEKFKYPDQRMDNFELDLSMFMKASYKLLDLK